jgi:hypothetical protein
MYSYSKQMAVYATAADNKPVAYPGIFSRRGSTNSVEDRGQRERGSGQGFWRQL